MFRRRVSIFLTLLALLALSGCNKYADYEVKTPVPPAPKQSN